MRRYFFIRRFKDDRRGATAIEFSMLALPFFLCLFAIIETSISFTAGQVLADATDDMARGIRTGQIDPATMNQAQFRDELCTRMEAMFPDGCPDLAFDVQQYASYSAVPKSYPIAGGRLNTAGFGYNPGGPGTINSMRVVYEWPVTIDVMKQYLANLEGGNILLFSTVTWRNEP